MSNLTENTEDGEKGEKQKLDRFLPKKLQDYLFQTRFFYPNNCHLCSPVQNYSYDKMIRCEKCNMISYCSELHKKEHEKQHKGLCRGIQNLLKSSGSTNLFNFMRNIIDPNKRLNEKYKLISTVEQGLKRKLCDFEKQMFLHPRICSHCLQSDPDSLVNCKFCPQVSFCKDHKCFTSLHNDNYFCLSYKYCFDLDSRFMLDERYEICVNTKNFPFLFPNSEILNLPNDMTKLVTYIEEKANLTPMMYMFGNNFWPSIWSKLYSNLLTLMYAIKNCSVLIEGRSELIIHIVGNQNSRRNNFAIHELLLHFIPQLEHLLIVVVGDELDETDIFSAREIGLCDECFGKEKHFTLEKIKIPYVAYVKNNPSYLTPHLIITYDFGESEVNFWDESLSQMVEIQAPFFMTTSSELRAKTEYEKVTKRFEDLKGKAWFKKNPYGAQRPYRDAWQDGLKFENNYIAFYSLYGAKISSPNKETEETSEKSSTEEQNVNSSKQSGASEDKEESKVEATSATKAQTSKSDPNFQKEKSESEVQEQKEGSNTSRKKKNKKSKTHKSSEHSVGKDKLDNSLKETKRKIVKLKEENDQLNELISLLENELPVFGINTGCMVVTLLEDIFTLKVCLDDLVNKLFEKFDTNDE